MRHMSLKHEGNKHLEHYLTFVSQPHQDLHFYMACSYMVPNLKCNRAPPAHLCFVWTPLLLQVSLTRLFTTDCNVFPFEN